MSNPASAAIPKSRHLLNVLANWGAFLIAAVGGLFISPYVVRGLGTDVYGLWVIVGSITSSLGILDLGMRSAVVRFIAQAHARGDHDAASERARHLRALFAGASILAILAGTVLVAILPVAFNVEPRLVGVGRISLALTISSLALTLSNSFSSGVLLAMERLDLLGVTDAISQVARITLLILVLKLGMGIVGVASVGFVVALSQYGATRVMARRNYPELKQGLSFPTWHQAKGILDVSFFSTIIYTSATLAAQAATLVIGATLPLAIAAYYAIGATLPDYAMALNRPIAQTVHPRAARLEGVGDAEGLKDLIINTGRYSALVLLPVAITFLLRGHTFIEIWQGPEFRGPSGTVLMILASGILFAGPRHVMQAAFIGSGRHRSLGPWYVLEAMVKIGATVVLARAIGLVGPAIANVVPALIVTAVIFPILCARYYNVQPSRLFISLWLRPALAMLPFAAATFAIERWMSASNYLYFFAQVTLAMPAAIAGAYLFGLTPSERTHILRLIQNRFPKQFKPKAI